MSDILERCSKCGAYLDGYEMGEGVLCPGEPLLDHYTDMREALEAIGWDVKAEVVRDE